MYRFAAALAFLLTAAPALAQPPARPAADQAGTEIEAAAEAFGDCIGTNAQRSDPEVTPEVAASAVMATCTPHRARLVDTVEAVIATLPAQQQAAARDRLRTGLSSAERQIADGIRAQRSGDAAAAAPAATPD